jgi:hypothetical protein
MQTGFGKFFLMAAALGLALAAGSLPATAADLGLMASPGGVGNCSELVFSCENGRQYPLCPIAVSVAGEVVTASLHIGPNSATHVRMIPMGVGYRYAGHGVWLDGFRENALLKFGKYTQIACTLQHS